MDVEFIDPVTVLLNVKSDIDSRLWRGNVVDKHSPWEWWEFNKNVFKNWKINLYGSYLLGC